MSNSWGPHGLQYPRLSWPSLSARVCSDSCPLSQWCSLTISSSVSPFSFCSQSFPESWYFPMNWLFTSGGQSIRASASASVLPMNIQGWFPLGWTGLISMLSKRLSRVFSSTTVQKHQFFITQPSLEMALGLWKRKWQPMPVFLSGESQGQGSLVGCRLWGHTESDMTEVT